MNTNRTMIRTTSGHRVYGAGTCIMDVSNDGKVIYSNVTEASKEYKMMIEFYKRAAK